MQHLKLKLINLIKLMCRYFIKLAIALGMLLSSHVAWTKPPISMYLPTGLQLGFDLYQPIYANFYRKTGEQYELNGLLDFKRLLLQGDYGWGIIQRKGISNKVKDIAGQYIESKSKNLGQYFRIGLDYNFIHNSVDDNAAFLGLRYAKSYFKDQLKSILPDELYQLTMSGETPEKGWGDYEIDSGLDMIQMRWFELVGGFRVKAWKWFYLGCTARYQFNKKITPHPAYIPFDIIGWGINGEDNFGLNIYLIIRFPLQKRMPIKENQPEKAASIK